MSRYTLQKLLLDFRGKGTNAQAAKRLNVPLGSFQAWVRGVRPKAYTVFWLEERIHQLRRKNGR